jgi:aryl-alcohol dehydrogenase-like predicted oxidoreductase
MVLVTPEGEVSARKVSRRRLCGICPGQANESHEGDPGISLVPGEGCGVEGREKGPRAMDTRRIGTLEASAVGIGCNNFGWRLDEAATRQVVGASLEAGINFFDTADSYGNTKSEEYLGRALGGRRDEVIVATKFGSRVDDRRQGARPEYVKQAAEDSLRRLGTDRIDLYQIHKPDPEVPIGETLGALDELVQAGKVREIGCSNFSVEQLREAEEAAPGGSARFVSVQNEYSIMHRDPEHGVIPECERLDLALIPYFPLASGLLTGKYRSGSPLPEGTRIGEGGRFSDLLSEENLSLVESLVEFAESRGHTVLELAFSWLIARPTVGPVIAGATSPSQVRANVAASDWVLSEAEITEVEEISGERLKDGRG